MGSRKVALMEEIGLIQGVKLILLNFVIMGERDIP
jgi:hypothetical protein